MPEKIRTHKVTISLEEEVEKGAKAPAITGVCFLRADEIEKLVSNGFNDGNTLTGDVVRFLLGEYEFSSFNRVKNYETTKGAGDPAAGSLAIGKALRVRKDLISTMGLDTSKTYRIALQVEAQAKEYYDNLPSVPMVGHGG